MLSIEQRIGISTHFLPATHGESIHDAIRMVAEAGFAGFEIVPSLDQAQIGYPANIANVGIDLFEAQPEDIAQLKRSLGAFRWVTVHAPHIGWNQASVNRHLRRLTWEYYDRCLEFAAEIGAVALSYHLGGPTPGYIRPESDRLELNLAYAEHILPLARQAGIPVGYEAGRLDELKWVADRLPGWGINLDIGHAYMYAHTDERFLAYIDEFAGSEARANRIVEIHHNGVNHYWGQYMEHQPPHMNNTIDFQGVYERLRDSSYAGPIVCEIQGNDIAQVIRHCQESKDMIVGIWCGTLRMRERWYLPA